MQAAGLIRAKRTAVGAFGEVDERLDLLRFAVDEQFTERGRSFVDRLPQRLEYLWIGVLSCEFQKLRERIHRGEGIVANEMQLIPKPIQLLPLSLVQHESDQLFILAIEQRNGNRFVHGHDLGVAKRGRKQL